MPTSKERKMALRKAIVQLKSNASPLVLHEESARLMWLLSQHPRFVSAKTVLLFHSLPDEPCTHGFIEQWYTSKNILLPVVCGDFLELRRYDGVHSLSSTGVYNIGEPVEGALFTEYSSIDLVVLPGVAFDAYGHRLGRGKGYYDRLLSHPDFANVYKMGVCFSFQSVDVVPAEAHDMLVDELLCVAP